MTAPEKARLWTWAHRELGDEACEKIQGECERRRRETGNAECICGEVLAVLMVLP